MFPLQRDRDYRHSQSLEPVIAARMGGIRCRYTGRTYRSLRQTDFEHVVAVSEAHDSGLCATDRPPNADSPTTCLLRGLLSVGTDGFMHFPTYLTRSILRTWANCPGHYRSRVSLRVLTFSSVTSRYK